MAKPQPMQGKRWRLEQLEGNKPDETYNAPKLHRDSSMSDEHRESGGHYMPQSDAYQTAAEHAVYAQAYQMYYGPYGYGTKGNENTKRQETLKKTAQAIEDCISGNSCGGDKQELILKALVQYNYGQELKRINLVNMTNKENMRSLVPADERLENDQTKAMAIQTRGSNLSGGKRRDAALGHAHGSARDPYFQLPVDETRGVKIRAANGSRQSLSPKDIEALGPQFMNEYKTFVRKFSRADDDPKYKQRYYKYVAARENTYVLDSTPGEHLTDDKRLAEVVKEQNNPNIRKMVDDHLSVERAITTKKQMLDGKEGMTVAGYTGGEAGLGDTAEGITVKRLDAKPGENPVATGYDRFPAIAADLNNAFKEAAEKKLNKDGGGQGRDLAQSGASMYQGQTPKQMADNMTVGVSLEPAEFDKFLNQIWPSSKERAEVIKN